MLIYDIWYKRIFTDILLYRERQIPYLSNQAAAMQEPFLRKTNSRFADYNDMTPLVTSFAIGAVLLGAV